MDNEKIVNLRFNENRSVSRVSVSISKLIGCEHNRFKMSVEETDRVRGKIEQDMNGRNLITNLTFKRCDNCICMKDIYIRPIIPDGRLRRSNYMIVEHMPSESSGLLRAPFSGPEDILIRLSLLDMDINDYYATSLIKCACDDMISENKEYTCIDKYFLKEFMAIRPKRIFFLNEISYKVLRDNKIMKELNDDVNYDIIYKTEMLDIPVEILFLIPPERFELIKGSVAQESVLTEYKKYLEKIFKLEGDNDGNNDKSIGS